MPHTRKLAAIMFTDIEGYTALMQHDEQRAVDTRRKHREVFKRTTAKYRGRILQYFGDGTLSIFDSAIEAVQCAIDLQRGFRTPPEVPVRIGIHAGDILIGEDEVIGDSVNIAARIESLAVAGSVLFSDKIYDDIKNQRNVDAVFLRSAQLKNVSHPVGIYAIDAEGLVVPRDGAQTHPSNTDTAQEATKKTPPVLATKLHIPASRSTLVSRPRLLQLLDRGQQDKLTLVCAPAGFGKTTLASTWISSNERPSAWLSLDDGDNDPMRFLAHFIAGLQKIASGTGGGLLDLIMSHQPPPLESILGELINEVALMSDPFNYVLDDYHVIKSESVHGVVAELLEQNLPHMHLLMTTREDPPLPLPRLRVRNQLNEVRISDLRFTGDEAAEFFSGVMHLQLSEENVQVLERRTEGWAAGLQLAALSLQGREDVATFIESFAGDDRYVLDYLAEEVLHNQPEDIRTFLLQTSILDRLYAPLCDALTGRDDAVTILHTLDRRNLFLISLDDVRQWYRYHHLFSEMLRSKLAQDDPDRVTLLHRRAGEWFEANDMLSEAIGHALLSEDHHWAAGLIERIWPTMERSLQEPSWLQWTRSLPEQVIRQMPVLSGNYAWALLSTGDIEEGEAWLNHAEKLLKSRGRETDGADAAAPIYVADETQYEMLPGTIAIVRAYIAQATGDTAATVKLAEQALALLPANDHIRRGTPMILLGFASWVNGDLDRAYDSIRDAFTGFERSGNQIFSIGGMFLLAEIRIAQGRLRDAEAVYNTGFEKARNYGKNIDMITNDLHFGWALLYNERGATEKAIAQFSMSRIDREQHHFVRHRRNIAEAKIREASGQFHKALALLREAEQVHVRSPMPDLQPVGGLIARVSTRLGQYGRALDWARDQGLHPDDSLSYTNEFGHMVLARALIACYRHEEREQCIEDAIQLLDRLLQAAESGGRYGSVIRILVLLALAHDARKKADQALLFLERALSIGENEGYLRVFTVEGAFMEALLTRVRNEGPFVEYTGRLLAAMDENSQKDAAADEDGSGEHR